MFKSLITFLSLFFTLLSFGQAREIESEVLNIIPETRIRINGPAKVDFNSRRPLRVVFYALPNGNSIEQTAGKIMEPGDDWHFDIQHIAAQTRQIRMLDKSHNYVVVYLESKMRAWTSYAAKYESSGVLFKKLVDSTLSLVSNMYDGQLVEDIIISGHSGGGRFMLNYLTSDSRIDDRVRKISFIDSNYGYETSSHAPLLAEWLKRDKRNKLLVLAYVDTTVVLNGKRIVSSKGGTGYRSRLMVSDLEDLGFKFKESADTTFKQFSEKRGQIAVSIKENPTGQIYHTVLVRRNGFVLSVLFENAKSFTRLGYWE